MAVLWGLDPKLLGRTLAADAARGDVNSTLLQTVLQRASGNQSYRTLVAGPSRAVHPRLDVLRKTPRTGRTTERRSLHRRLPVDQGVAVPRDVERDAVLGRSSAHDEAPTSTDGDRLGIERGPAAAPGAPAAMTSVMDDQGLSTPAVPQVLS